MHVLSYMNAHPPPPPLKNNFIILNPKAPIHTNIDTLLKICCKISSPPPPPIPNINYMWPALHSKPTPFLTSIYTTIPTSSFLGAHGGHFLLEDFPGLSGAELWVVLGQGAAGQWQGGALYSHSLVTDRLRNKKMDVKI